MTSRAYYIAHREEILAKRAARRGAHLEEERAAGRARYQANRDRYGDGHKAYYRRLRREMFTAYGDTCACCGEDERTFLALVARGSYRRWRRRDGQLDTFRALRELRKDGWPSEAAQLLCRNCLAGSVRYAHCPHRIPQHRREPDALNNRGVWLRSIWAQALAAFGGHCTCCGESEPAFLTLDHVKGRGEAHRRELGVHDNLSILIQLRDAGWPQDGRYRLLCWCCQWGVQQSDGCPHARLSAHYVGGGRVPLPSRSATCPACG